MVTGCTTCSSVTGCAVLELGVHDLCPQFSANSGSPRIISTSGGVHRASFCSPRSTSVSGRTTAASARVHGTNFGSLRITSASGGVSSHQGQQSCVHPTTFLPSDCVGGERAPEQGCRLFRPNPYNRTPSMTARRPSRSASPMFSATVYLR